MLSDERITKVFQEVFDLRDSRPIGKQLEFVHAIEREATAPLIEQIKKDEALMRQAVISLGIGLECAEDWMDSGACSSITAAINTLRQRLEVKK